VACGRLPAREASTGVNTLLSALSAEALDAIPDIAMPDASGPDAAGMPSPLAHSPMVLHKVA